MALSLASIGGGAMVISGFVLIFPFSNGITVSGMELTEIVHSVVGMVFIAIIVAHIRIGTLGVEGAFEAMGEGAVDTNWPKQHYSLWVAQEIQAEEAATVARMTRSG